MGLETFHNLKMDIRRLELPSLLTLVVCTQGVVLASFPGLVALERGLVRGIGTRLGVVLAPTCRAEALAAEIKELQGEMADYNTEFSDQHTISDKLLRCDNYVQKRWRSLNIIDCISFTSENLICVELLHLYSSTYM